MNKRKILVIRYKPLRNFIQTIPAFAAIRKYHKNDEIYILTEQSLVKFCRRTKFFDKIWLDTKPDWINPMGVVDLLKRLRKGGFDMVYDLQNDDRTVWYFRLFGFRKPNWNSSKLTWCTFPYKPKENETFQEMISNQIKVTGIKSVPQIDISYIGSDENFDLPEKYAMFCAAGSRENPYHAWHPLKYAEVIDYIYETHGLISVLIGDNADDLTVNDLISNQCVKIKPINLSGKTSIGSIMQIAKNALFCLGNDTTPTHMAAYTGCPTIMFCSQFSPSETTAPKVKNIAVIEEDNLEDVEIERAITAIEKFGLVSQETTIEPFKTVSDNQLQKAEFSDNTN